MNTTISHTQAPLIPVFSGEINHERTELVNARDLHQFLNIKRDFSTWVKDRIRKYKFIENQDFISFHQNGGKPLGGRPECEYHITLDMAKELAMLQRSAQGRAVRRYFIEAEKRYRQAGDTPASLSHLQQELLRNNPLWSKIKRYSEMGLSRSEIALLVKRKSTTLREHIRRMEACGLMQPPANLAQLQQMALRLK